MALRIVWVVVSTHWAIDRAKVRYCYFWAVPRVSHSSQRTAHNDIVRFKGRNNLNLEFKFWRVPNRTIGRNTVTYSNLVVGPEESTCRSCVARALSRSLFLPFFLSRDVRFAGKTVSWRSQDLFMQQLPWSSGRTPVTIRRRSPVRSPQ